METDSEEWETKGWLLKWTNYAKGYKKRWFILSNGILSYYRKQGEAHMQRGAMYLENAIFHSYDTCSFVISRADTHNTLYLKADNTSERDYWISCLEKAKIWVISNNEKDTKLQWYANFEEYERVILTAISEVGSKLEYFQDANNTLHNDGNSLKTQLTILQNIKTKEDFPPQIAASKEKAELFKISSDAMIKVLSIFIELAIIKYSKNYSLLLGESEQRLSLEKLVKQIDGLLLLLDSAIKSKDMSIIVQNYTMDADSIDDTISTRSSRVDKSFTAYEMEALHDNSLKLSSSCAAMIPNDLKGSLTKIIASSGINNKRPKKERRTRVPDKPNLPVNLWGIMKNSIGKDLSTIPMPVNFSEPLSFLQRAAEDFAYSDILDKAATCNDPCEQLAYLGAFLVSGYASTVVRTAKPFNPLLGETFEWDRTDDLGWRLITEQVSHHPPISAQFCESKEWTCWQEFSMSSKFRGKYLMITPHGVSHILFSKSGNHYMWKKVVTLVNNIIIGKLWVDNVGETEILSKKDSSKCELSFIPYSVFKTDDQKKVTGQVKNNEQEVKFIISGKWDNELRMSEVVKISGKPDNPSYETGEPIIMWKYIPPPEDSSKYYNFSLFASQLNEIEEDIAPTDSRLRPDQRLMENGQWDEANLMKTALENKQRSERKKSTVDQNLKESVADTASSSTDRHVHVLHEPVWFKTEIDPSNGRLSYIYKGGYWEAKKKQNWGKCPNIYL